MACKASRGATDRTQITERDQAIAQIKRYQDSINLGNIEIAKQEQVVADAQQARQPTNALAPNQAISLALELKQNSPCLVCGSTEHPQPAQAVPGTTSVTQEDIDKALNAEQVARTKRQRYESKFETLQTQLKEKQDALKGWVDALGEHRGLSESDIDTHIAHIQTHINQAQQATQTVTSLQQQIETLQQAIDAQRTQLQSTQNSIEGLKGQLTQLNSDHDELIQHIPESSRDMSIVDASADSNRYN